MLDTLQLTLRHKDAQNFGYGDTVFELVILQNGADRARGGTHRRVQHVNVLSLHTPSNHHHHHHHHREFLRHRLSRDRRRITAV